MNENDSISAEKSGATQRRAGATAGAPKVLATGPWPNPHPDSTSAQGSRATLETNAGIDSDSAREFLVSLQSQRGTPLLSERDYLEMRQSILTELARGPALKLSTLFTMGVVGLILFGLFLIGLAMMLNNGAADWLLATASGGCLALWTYVLWQYISSVRQHARLSLRERLEELEELRRHELITQPEFERIYAAIHSARGIPLEPGAH